MLLIFLVVVAIIVAAVVVDNDEDKYNSTFHIVYTTAASRGGNDTFLCLKTYHRNGMQDILCLSHFILHVTSFNHYLKKCLVICKKQGTYHLASQHGIVVRRYLQCRELPNANTF